MCLEYITTLKMIFQLEVTTPLITVISKKLRAKFTLSFLLFYTIGYILRWLQLYYIQSKLHNQLFIALHK